MMGKRFDYDLQQRAVDILQQQILNEITTELIMKIVTATVENKLGEKWRLLADPLEDDGRNQKCTGWKQNFDSVSTDGCYNQKSVG